MAKVITMKKMKKIISMFLCFAMMGYGFPALAVQTTDTKSSAEITVISDAEMQLLVGAGTVDAKVAEYASGEPAVAVFANRSNYSSATYTLYESNANGGFVADILSGSLAPGEAVIVSGPITYPAGGYMIQGKITQNTFPGIHAADSFMH